MLFVENIKATFSNMKLERKIILIVGASQGIGAALAYALAPKNNTIIVVARRLHKLEEVKAKVEQLGSKCHCIAADALDRERAAEVVREVVTKFGQIDVGILNVGGGDGAFTDQLSAKEITDFMEWNYHSMIHYFSPLVAYMKLQKIGGQIVHMNSLAGFTPAPFMGHYGSTKAACRMFLDTARVELKDENIRITTLCPGFMDTPAMEKNDKPTPFIMTASYAATKMIKAIEREKKTYLFPFPLAFATRFGQVLPKALKELIFGKIMAKDRAEWLRKKN